MGSLKQIEIEYYSLLENIIAICDTANPGERDLADAIKAYIRYNTSVSDGSYNMEDLKAALKRLDTEV